MQEFCGGILSNDQPKKKKGNKFQINTIADREITVYFIYTLITKFIN